VKGKLVRVALDMDIFTMAKIRLPDKLKVIRKPKAVLGRLPMDGCNITAKNKLEGKNVRRHACRICLNHLMD
jgi:hypothetical protein